MRRDIPIKVFLLAYGGNFMSRRLNGEGSLYFNKSRNRWEYQFYCVINGKKSRKKVTGKTRKETKERAEIAKKNYEQSSEEIITISNWLKKWLLLYIKDHVSIKTEERYTLAINKHIIPYIGNENIRTLTAIKIQQYIHELHRHGGQNKNSLSPSTVNSARTILSSALKQAVGNNIIIKNPVDFTKPIKKSRITFSVLSSQECKKLTETAYHESNKAYWIAIAIALETGFRKGEIFGLCWADIDLERKTISVNKTVVTGNHGMIIQESTKTKSSRRTVTVTDSLIEKIRKYKIWQTEYLNNINITINDDTFLITSETGTIKDPNSYTDKVFKRILKSAGLSTKIRFHDLRHTHATQLLEAGTNIKAVSERLGHTNIRTTLDTYTHVLPSMKDDLIKNLDTLNLSGYK